MIRTIVDLPLILCEVGRKGKKFEKKKNIPLGHQT